MLPSNKSLDQIVLPMTLTLPAVIKASRSPHLVSAVRTAVPPASTTASRTQKEKERLRGLPKDDALVAPGSGGSRDMGRYAKQICGRRTQRKLTAKLGGETE